ncbi:oligopeptide/dipeptide ABC transporter ATP-binding protein [Streptomyces sp. NPDC055092]
MVAQTADHVAVMYAGQIVEQAPASALCTRPAHPYTRALMDAVPRRGHRGLPLIALPGSPPDATRPTTACPFLPRRPLARAECGVAPPVHTLGNGHTSSCHRWQEVTVA